MIKADEFLLKWNSKKLCYDCSRSQDETEKMVNRFYDCIKKGPYDPRLKPILANALVFVKIKDNI